MKAPKIQLIYKQIIEKERRIYEQLAGIPTVQVANIAAALISAGGNEVEAVRKAYKLLEIAEYCNMTLRGGCLNVAHGISLYQNSVELKQEIHAVLRGDSHYDYKYFAKREKPNVPFADGLKSLMPRVKKDERESRFRTCWKDFLTPLNGAYDASALNDAVARDMANFKRDGISKNQLDMFETYFPVWWAEQKSAVKTASGKKGQAVKKANAKNRAIPQDVKQEEAESPNKPRASRKKKSG